MNKFYTEIYGKKLTGKALSMSIHNTHNHQKKAFHMAELFR